MPLHDHHKDWILLFFLLVLLGAAFYITMPYLSAIFTGALLAYLLRPAYDWLSTKTKSEKLGGIILSIIAVAIFTGLLALLITAFTTQATQAYQLTKDYLAQPDEELMQYLDFININTFKQQALTFIEEAPKRALPYTSKLITNILNLFLFITIAIFSTAYFLIKGKQLRKAFLESLPLKTTHRDKIANRFDETMKAVINGNIGTSIMQGIAAGIIFFLAGVPASILLAFILTLAAFIPAVGPVIIWVPVAGFMLLKGNITGALVVAALCATILGYIDNILKPKIIGDKIKLGSFIIFIAVIGGIHTFGILGIFAGPLIFALLSTCIEIYKTHINSSA